MAKKDTWIILVIIGIILFMILMPKGPVDKNFMEVRLYDSNGKLIGTTENIGSANWFSIVNGVTGVASFDISINVKNTGTQALSCTPNSLTPSVFNTAMTKTTQNVLAGKSIGWTSDKMTASQFETAPTPDIFSASVTCTWTGSPVTKTGTLSLTISPDASGADFTLSLNPGGLGTEFCGDGICQSSETTTSCPADCTFTTNVKFRTTDLGYVSGSAIGYTSTCGSTLTKYGYYSSTGILTGTCDTISTWCGTNPTKVLDNLPGGWKSGGPTPSLWKVSETDTLCICDSDGSKYNQIKFKTTDSDASKVDSSAISIDPSKEVVC